MTEFDPNNPLHQRVEINNDTYQNAALYAVFGEQKGREDARMVLTVIAALGADLRGFMIYNGLLEAIMGIDPKTLPTDSKEAQVISAAEYVRNIRDVVDVDNIPAVLAIREIEDEPEDEPEINFDLGKFFGDR